MTVDLNLGHKNRAVCALVGKDGTVHKVKHISLAACSTTDVYHLLASPEGGEVHRLLKCRNCGTVYNSHVNAAINIGRAWFIREEKRLQKKIA